MRKRGVFLAVLAIGLSKIRMSPGRMVRVHSMLSSTPLARTNPRSAPILRLMNTMASKPRTVVVELLAMDEKALVQARFMASALSGVCSRSCR